MTKAKKIEPIVLKAKKVKELKGSIKTELYQNGALKAIIPSTQTQPRKGQKTINLNGWKFKLDW